MFRAAPPFGPLPATAIRILRHPVKYARLVLRLMGDRRVPFFLRTIPGGALAYVLSPIDVAPDILVPLIGMTDDVLILLLAVHIILTRAPRGVVEEHALAIAGVKKGDGS